MSSKTRNPLADKELQEMMSQRAEQDKHFQTLQGGPKSLASRKKVPSQLGADLFSEGYWASPEDSTTHHLPFPHEGTPWKGKEEYFEDLKLVMRALHGAAVIYRQQEKCRICGLSLPSVDYFDKVNKLRFPASLEHYAGQHNVVPTRFFWSYVRLAAGALKGQPVQLPTPAQPAPAPPQYQQPPPAPHQQPLPVYPQQPPPVMYQQQPHPVMYQQPPPAATYQQPPPITYQQPHPAMYQQPPPVYQQPPQMYQQPPVYQQPQGYAPPSAFYQQSLPLR